MKVERRDSIVTEQAFKITGEAYSSPEMERLTIDIENVILEGSVEHFNPED